MNHKVTFQFSTIDILVAVSTVGIALGCAIWLQEVVFNPLLPLWGTVAVVWLVGIIAVTWSTVAVFLTQRRAWSLFGLVLFHVAFAAAASLMRMMG